MGLMIQPHKTIRQDISDINLILVRYKYQLDTKFVKLSQVNNSFHLDNEYNIFLPL